VYACVFVCVRITCMHTLVSTHKQTTHMHTHPFSQTCLVSSNSFWILVILSAAAGS